MYENYVKLRDKKGLKDSDVVRATGIGQGVFSDWKKGRYTPKIDKLQKIADFFGVSVDYLTSGKDTAKESISGKVYYFDDEAAETAQKLYENSDLRMLFDAAQDVDAENLQLAAEMLKRFKGINND